MATPIKITPILEGQNSVWFNQQLEAKKDVKVSKEERDRMLKLFEDVIKNSTPPTK